MSFTQFITQLGAAGAGGVSDYWIATIGTANADVAQSVTVDGDDNIYISGYTVQGSYYAVVAKLNTTGEVQWANQFGSGGNFFGRGIDYDSGTGDIVVVGDTNSGVSGGTYEQFYTRWNTNGTLDRQRWKPITGGTVGTDRAYRVHCNSDGTYAVAGSNTHSSNYGGVDAWSQRLNSSLNTTVWSKTHGQSSTRAEIYYHVTEDNGGNSIFVGKIEGASYDDMLISKLNSSGTVQWHVRFGNTSADQYAWGVVVDSVNNIYVTGYGGPAPYHGIILKFNSSGTLQWQRKYSTGSDTFIGYDCAIDSSNNIYMVGYTAAGTPSNDNLAIVKVNNSGTLQWARCLGSNGSEATRHSIVIDSNDNIVVCGVTDGAGAGSNEALIARLPSDGSLTGTYGVWTYEALSGTLTTPSFTDSGTGLNDGSFTHSIATTSYSNTTLSYTETVEYM